MSKKRVVLLRSNPVSPDPPVEKTANTLLGQGYEITIVGWDRASGEKERSDTLCLPNGEAKVVRFGIPAVFGGGLKQNLKPLAVFQYRLYRWLKRHVGEYDIVHAFDFDTGYMASKIAKRYKKALVYHILDFYTDSHNLQDSKLGSIIKQMEFSVINCADCTIICTEKRREQIEGSNPKRLEIIHNTPNAAINTTEQIKLENSAGRCRIVYVGILAGSRFIQEVIDVVKRDDRFELHIGGFGKLEEHIRQEAEACSRVVFYGKLPYAKTLALEQNCDIMTAIYDPSVPNHRYAAPNKFYESLMLGKPVIMARNTGFDEIIEENDIGCLIDYTQEGLALGLDKLLSLKGSWGSMSQRMKQLYQSKYSWAEMENRLINLYTDLEYEKDTDRQ